MGALDGERVAHMQNNFNTTYYETDFIDTANFGIHIGWMHICPTST